MKSLETKESWLIFLDSMNKNTEAIFEKIENIPKKYCIVGMFLFNKYGEMKRDRVEAIK